MAIPSPQSLKSELRGTALPGKGRKKEWKPRKGNYPYVTARVKAKRTLLLSKEAFDRMLMMEIPEIARFLGEGEYREQMNTLGARYSGVDLIELATSRNLARTYTKIYNYSEGELQDMIGRYLDRYDLENLKSILRGKTSRASAEEILEDLVPAGSFDAAILRRLVDATTLESLFEDVKGTIYEAAYGQMGGRASDLTDWSAWEDFASRLYYAQLLASIPPTSDANRLMAEFVRREIDVLNLKTLLRTWMAKARFEREIFIEGGHEFKVPNLHEMTRMDREALLKSLTGYSVARPILPDFERVEETGLGAIIRRVEKNRLLQAERYSHLHPLSVLPVLDYVIRKDREVQNIRIIARGKESGLSIDVIRDLLVV